MTPASTEREPLFTGPFFRLWCFTFMTFFSAFQLFPTIPFRVIALGGTKSQAGMFLAIYTYACAFSAPITGTVADHFGRKKLLIISAALFVVFSVLYGVTTHLPLLLIFACVHGCFWSAILSSSSAIMSEIIPEARRTEGIAYWGMASTAAVAVAPLVGLTLYRKGWWILCAEMAVLSVMMIVLALRIQGGTSTSEAPFPAIREIVDWRVLVTAMSLFVISFSYGGITSYVAMLALERSILPPSLFFSVFAGTILITRVFSAPYADRLGPKFLLYPSLAVIPFALAILSIADSRLEICAAAVLFGTGFGGAYPAFVTYVLRHTDPNRRASTFGSILWAFDTGIGTGSLVLGMLIQHKGFFTAFATAAVFSTLSIPIFLLTSRALGSRETTASTEPPASPVGP